MGCAGRGLSGGRNEARTHRRVALRIRPGGPRRARRLDRAAPCGAEGGYARGRDRYGTTIRAFDLTERRWHATWINPVSGALDQLVARREGDDIVHEGRKADGTIVRWVFTDIEENSARWYGERSMDDGETWVLEAEFFLTRR